VATSRHRRLGVIYDVTPYRYRLLGYAWSNTLQTPTLSGICRVPPLLHNNFTAARWLPLFDRTFNLLLNCVRTANSYLARRCQCSHLTGHLYTAVGETTAHGWCGFKSAAFPPPVRSGLEASCTYLQLHNLSTMVLYIEAKFHLSP
jgi:hypothetical protein